MTDIILSNTDQAVDEEEKEQEEKEQEEEEKEQEDEEEDNEPRCIMPTDDDYSEMPHFPEPISLIVNEL